jgi:hypothetical protein
VLEIAIGGHRARVVAGVRASELCTKNHLKTAVYVSSAKCWKRLKDSGRLVDTATTSSRTATTHRAGKESAHQD